MGIAEMLNVSLFFLINCKIKEGRLVSMFEIIRLSRLEL